MISEKMKGYVKNSSVIRAMFEEGKKMAAIYGADHVYDFSLGNPNVPAPAKVKEAVYDILENEDSLMVHGYMSNSGYEDVRGTIAEHLNGLYGTSYSAENLLMIVGAAGGMNVFMKTILNPGDEVITFSPYFTEYRAYVTNYDGRLVEIPCDAETFQPDVEALAASVNERTKAVIINSPNNPTGVVYRKRRKNSVIRSSFSPMNRTVRSSTVITKFRGSRICTKIQSSATPTASRCPCRASVSDGSASRRRSMISQI